MHISLRIIFERMKLVMTEHESSKFQTLEEFEREYFPNQFSSRPDPEKNAESDAFGEDLAIESLNRFSSSLKG